MRDVRQSLILMEIYSFTQTEEMCGTNHNVMPNADYNSNPDNGLLGDLQVHLLDLLFQNQETNQYYIFAVDEPHHQNAFAFPNQGPTDEFGNPIFDYDSGGVFLVQMMVLIMV